MTGPDPDRYHRLSFRDPDGRLFLSDGRIFRVIHADAAPAVSAFLTTPSARTLIAAGRLIDSRILERADAPAVVRDLESGDSGLILEHSCIPFVNFPHEWPAEMLYDAGRLTLELATAALDDGFGLKDATPYNVTFSAGKPVFLDFLSFERRDSLDPMWLPYTQFVRTFLLPLLAARYYGLAPCRVFVSHRDGLEPVELYRLANPVRRLIPPFLSAVSIPVWLDRGHRSISVYRRRSRRDAAEARFILRGVFRSLANNLERTRPDSKATSAWSRYPETCTYSADQTVTKQEFVAALLDGIRPSRVLDIGCNTGEFSLVAARHGASVVAIDSDPIVVGKLWERARAERLDVVPLVVDLARPSPGIGWRNAEYPAFLDRARGHFDVVLMLAVLHHLLIDSRVPLEDVIELAADLTRDIAIIEFVAVRDPLFQQLARGRERLFDGLTLEKFEAAARQRFNVLKSVRIPGAHRWLYALRKK